MPHVILEKAIQLALAIYKQAGLVKDNQEQTKRLSTRVQVVVSSIQGLSQLPQTQQFKEALQALIGCLTDIKTFMDQFIGTHHFKKILFAGSYQEDFVKFNQMLADLLLPLNVGLSAQQLIDKNQDRIDEQADRMVIAGKLDEIKAYQERMLREVQKTHLDPAELEKMIQCQLASVETRLKEWAHPRIAKSLLPKDLQVHFYDVTFESKKTEGRLGAIYTGYSREQPVVIKLIDLSMSTNERQQWVREAQIMSRLHSDYIIRFYGACLENGRDCLLMQQMEKGDLEAMLPHLTLPERIKMAQDLARGLHYLHEQGVTHGDIKPKHVLINRHNEAKWSGFGFSKAQQMSIASVQITSQEARWQAPETWQSRAELSSASDVYSFGMLLWTLLTGKLPYATLFNEKIIAFVQLGKRETIPDDCPAVYARLMKACWERNPLIRPKAIDLIHGLDSVRLEPVVRSVSPNADELYQQAVSAHKLNKLPKALELYTRAEAKGSIKALTSLGLFSLEGLGGLPVDKTQAKALLEKAATAGHGRACFNLGRMHEKADGVTQNYSLALRYYRMAVAAEPDNTQYHEKVDVLSRLLESTANEESAYMAFTH